MNRQTLIKRFVIGEFSLKRMIRFLIILYVAVGAWAYFYSERLIFVPQPSSYVQTPEFLTLKTVKDVKITALSLPNSKAKYTILYSHGNAEDLGNNRFLLERFRQMGFAVFAYDYPGYGTSEGKPSEQGSYQAIDAAYNYLTQQLKIPPNQIIVYGRSVGGGPSVDLASRQPVGGLVLESTFMSTFRVKIDFPLYPFDRFANLSKIPFVKAPVLVIHGTVDQVIPFSHGQRLFAAVNTPKLSFWVEGADHNNVIEVAGDRYEQKLKEFIQIIKN
ncbi:alpha/beta hydrolase [Planktothrix mougeotii]|uniref:Alpha/beta hydrolase n=1 Tax=Planktothrix mougeotii LEGE 06226 TaxID=1828728 RepID=A0ABR9U7S0_9CYAN|nr:alpha/beta hydrolase [Planktothrix mougeotii]MBE9142490.1 alpha/beta hydrolase [Planktothrix mougeotii LEGE 06226]